MKIKALQKISSSLLYLFIFFLPWQTIYFLRESYIEGEKWHYGTIGIYGSLFFLFAWLVVEIFINRKFIKSCLIKSKGSFYVVILFLSSLLISFSFSDDFILSLYYFAVLVIGIMFFLLIQKAKFKLKKLLFVFILAASLQGMFGLGQFILQETFSCKWLGLEEHVAWVGGSSVIETNSQRWIRAYGSFSHPNVLGGFLGIGVTFSLGAILFLKNNLREKIFLLTSLILIFVGLIVSFSRSAWLMLFTGVCFLIGYLFFHKRQYMGYCLKSLSILFLLIVFFVLSYSNLFFARISIDERLEQKSVNERISQAISSREIIESNFLRGVGLGGYTLKIWNDDNNKKPIWSYQPMHNIYLLIFAEAGLVSFTIFLVIVGGIIKRGIKKVKRGDKESFLLIAFVFLLGISFLDHWLYTSYFGIMIFCLVGGLVFRDSNKIEC